MERILTVNEAENAISKLTDKDKIRIMNDRICFGEYFIAIDQNTYFRINPINVVIDDGKPVSLLPNDTTII